MAYIVVGIAIWIVAGIAIALLLGRAIKVADVHQRRDRIGTLANTVSALVHTVTKR